MKSLESGLNLLLLSLALVQAEEAETEVLLGTDLTLLNPSIAYADGSGADKCQFYATPADLVWMCQEGGVSSLKVLPNEQPYNRPLDQPDLYKNSRWQAELGEGGNGNGRLERGFTKVEDDQSFFFMAETNEENGSVLHHYFEMKHNENELVPKIAMNLPAKWLKISADYRWLMFVEDAEGDGVEDHNEKTALFEFDYNASDYRKAVARSTEDDRFYIQLGEDAAYARDLYMPTKTERYNYDRHVYSHINDPDRVFTQREIVEYAREIDGKMQLFVSGDLEIPERMAQAAELDVDGVTRFQSFERLGADGTDFWMFHDDQGSDFAAHLHQKSLAFTAQEAVGAAKSRTELEYSAAECPTAGADIDAVRAAAVLAQSVSVDTCGGTALTFATDDCTGPVGLAICDPLDGRTEIDIFLDPYYSTLGLNDQISSIIVPAGFDLQVWQHLQSGDTTIITGSCQCISMAQIAQEESIAINNEISTLSYWRVAPTENSDESEDVGRELQAEKKVQETKKVTVLVDGQIIVFESDDPTVYDYGKHAWISKAANVPYLYNGQYTSNAKAGVVVAISSLKTYDEGESWDLHVGFHLITPNPSGSSQYSVIKLETEISEFDFIEQNKDAADWIRNFQATFSNGLFTWARKDSPPQQMRACPHTHYQGKETHLCEACPYNYGTSQPFGGAWCISCGQMWINSVESEVESLEYLTAFKLCSDPEAVYRREEAARELDREDRLEEATLTHDYRWAEDSNFEDNKLNDVTTSIKNEDGKKFTQITSVRVAGPYYNRPYEFKTVSSYDGESFNVTTEWQFCSKTWTNLDIEEDNWIRCKEDTRLQRVSMHVAASYAKNYTWELPNQAYMAEYLMEGPDQLIYSTYVDFGTMTWMEVLTKGIKAEVLANNTWSLANAGLQGTEPPLALPTFYQSDAPKFENAYKFDIGNSYVRTNVEVNAEGKLAANIEITVQSQTYNFQATYEWGSDLEAEVNDFAAETKYQGCSASWSVANEAREECSRGTNQFGVEMETTSSFDRWNEWPVRNADVRTQFKIDYEDTVFSIYINFESLLWTEVFEDQDESLGEAEWSFVNSGWDAAANTLSSFDLVAGTCKIEDAEGNTYRFEDIVNFDEKYYELSYEINAVISIDMAWNYCTPFYLPEADTNVYGYEWSHIDSDDEDYLYVTGPMIGTESFRKDGSRDYGVRFRQEGPECLSGKGGNKALVQEITCDPAVTGKLDMAEVDIDTDRIPISDACKITLRFSHAVGCPVTYLPKQTVAVSQATNTHTFDIAHNDRVYTFDATYSWDGVTWSSKVSTPSVWLFDGPPCEATTVVWAPNAAVVDCGDTGAIHPKITMQTAWARGAAGQPLRPSDWQDPAADARMIVTLQSAGGTTEFMAHFFLEDTRMMFSLYDNFELVEEANWDYERSYWYWDWRTAAKLAAQQDYVTAEYNSALKSLNYEFPATSSGQDFDASVITSVTSRGYTFEQRVTIPIGDETYVFNSEYTWDPADSESFLHKVTFESCVKKWRESTAKATEWHVCGPESDFDHQVEVLTTTSFDSENQWLNRDAQVRSMFLITAEEKQYRYVTYINFDELRWEEHYWSGDQMLGKAVWEFLNTEWNSLARNDWSKVDAVSGIGCNIQVQDQQTIKQTCTIPVSDSTSADGEKKNYVFHATYYYTGASGVSGATADDFWTTVSLGAADEGCSKTWQGNTGQQWNDCGAVAFYEHNVKTRVTTNWNGFSSQSGLFGTNQGADVRAEFYIADLETKLITYIDYSDTKPVFNQALYQSGEEAVQFVTRLEDAKWTGDWDFTNSLWNWDNRKGTTMTYGVIDYTATIDDRASGAGHIQFSSPVNFQWLSVVTLPGFFQFSKQNERNVSTDIVGDLQPVFYNDNKRIDFVVADIAANEDLQVKIVMDAQEYGRFDGLFLPTDTVFYEFNTARSEVIDTIIIETVIDTGTEDDTITKTNVEDVAVTEEIEDEDDAGAAIGAAVAVLVFICLGVGLFALYRYRKKQSLCCCKKKPPTAVHQEDDMSILSKRGGTEAPSEATNIVKIDKDSFQDSGSDIASGSVEPRKEDLTVVQMSVDII